MFVCFLFLLLAYAGLCFRSFYKKKTQQIKQHTKNYVLSYSCNQKSVSTVSQTINQWIKIFIFLVGVPSCLIRSDSITIFISLGCRWIYKLQLTRLIPLSCSARFSLDLVEPIAAVYLIWGRFNTMLEWRSAILLATVAFSQTTKTAATDVEMLTQLLLQY